MRIGAVSMNSSVNRTQTAIKKISAISKPRTFAVDEVSDNLSNVGQIDRENHLHDGAKNHLNTLSSEVNVWV